MGKAVKEFFSVAIVLCDSKMQSTLSPMNSGGQGHLVTKAKGHLV